jgi:hypothetical protein
MSSWNWSPFVGTSGEMKGLRLDEYYYGAKGPTLHPGSGLFHWSLRRGDPLDIYGLGDAPSRPRTLKQRRRKRRRAKKHRK